jgi:hypothetical protein
LEPIARVAHVRGLEYVVTLLAVLAGLPLVAPRWLLPALPAVAINLASGFPAALDVRDHYVTLVLPGMFLAAGIGLARVVSASRRAAPSARVLAPAALVLASLAGHMVDGATPASLAWRAEPYRIHKRDRGTLCWYARQIARHPEVSVMSPAAAIGHLAERRHVYSWAFDHPEPDVAILDVRQRQWVQVEPSRWLEPMEREIERVDSDPAYGLWRSNPPYRVMWRGLPGGRERIDALSPGRVPAAAVAQRVGWPGFVRLAGLEARLAREREQYSGRYRARYVVLTTFYWIAERRLPPGLLVRVVLSGPSKSQASYHLPTWGMRDTSTWKPGEVIRDEQWSTSPGGWPLEAISATVQLVDRDADPYPPGSQPLPLAW